MRKLTAVGLGLTGVTVVTVAILFTTGVLSLVVTRGTSMEPAFQTGDLAILRRATNFAVGDVVTYRSDLLRTVVMHRITEVHGDRYTLQGDNNSWLDPEQPPADQLLGKLAMRVPQGGVWLDRAVSSKVPVLAGAFLILSGGSVQMVTRRPRRRQRRTVQEPVAQRLRVMPPRLLMSAAVAAAAVAATSAFAIAAWTAAPDERAVGQRGHAASVAFSYSATVPLSAAYDGTTVSEPQPVFRALIDEVDVGLTYDSTNPVTDATVQIDAELSTSNGWKSVVPLRGPRSFSGRRYVDHVGLDLDALQARANAAATAIRGDVGAAVNLVVVAQIRAADGGHFRAELPFILDTVSLRLANGEETPVVAHDAAAPDVPRAPELSVLGYAVPIAPARTASLVALLLVLVACAGIGLWGRRTIGAPEPVRIQQRYGSLLLSVEPVALPLGRPLVEVPVMADLARLAERYGLMVMHWCRGGVHTYVVLEEQTTYRYRNAKSAQSAKGHGAVRARGAVSAP